MVKPLEQKKRQKILTGFLIAFILTIVILWYFGFQKKPHVEDSLLLEEPPATDLPAQEIKLDLSILDDTLFKSLKPHGLLPVTVGETGRLNPFEPY